MVAAGSAPRTAPRPPPLGPGGDTPRKLKLSNGWGVEGGFFFGGGGSLGAAYILELIYSLMTLFS